MNRDTLIKKAGKAIQLDTSIPHCACWRLVSEKMAAFAESAVKAERVRIAELEGICSFAGIELLPNGEYQYTPKYQKEYVEKKTLEDMDRLREQVRVATEALNYYAGDLRHGANYGEHTAREALAALQGETPTT